MRKFLLVCFSLAFVFSTGHGADFEVARLSCMYQENPIGVDELNPTLSWQLTSQFRTGRQAAYRILVSENSQNLKKNQGEMWNSGKVNSMQSIHIPYAGKPLESGKVYYWKVMVWDKNGKPSGWSETGFWQMGLLNKADWQDAKWLSITPWNDSLRVVPGLHVPHNNPDFGKPHLGMHALPLFRKAFSVKKPIKRATTYISGLGHYELTVNGKKANKDFLAPGWTNYDDYVYYNTIDVTAALKTGKNAVGVMLGNGFYNVPNERYRKLLVAYGAPKMICKIVIEYRDGSSEVILSDGSWKTDRSPVTFTSIYGGEDYDATLEQKGWNTAEFDDKSWKQPVIVFKQEQLRSQIGYPMAVMDTFSVKKISQPATSTWVYDMGQNASAIPQITVKGNAKSKIKITPGELIHDNGLVNQSASGDPHYYVYTLKGDGVESWQSRFTYYGFRYIQIEGAVPEGEPNPHNLPVVLGVRSLHVRNAAPATGTFKSSNVLFNQIFTLINWAVKSNIAHVVTDCPHREKLGWLEETYLMGNSIQLNFDMALLNKKMFADMKSAQLKSGLIPDIVPEYVPFDGGFRDSPEWGSAAVILPWYCYQWYGDRAILADHYDMMKKYVDYLSSKASNNILMHGLGDWFDMGPGTMGESQLTPKGLTPTATYYYGVTLLAKTAEILGKADDAARFKRLAPEIRKAFNQKFYNADKKQYGSGSQTANAMAIYFGLAEDKEAVYKSLVNGIENGGYVLTAGDVGFHYLVKVLSEGGGADVLYKMNNRNDVPGYGYQLAHGATSLTESWPALRNVSNNHLMLGHLMEWFYEGIGGIRNDEEGIGYQKIIIQPQFPVDLNEAETSYLSPYGKIATKWKKEGKRIKLEIEIPVNATAKVILPVNDLKSVLENGKSMQDCKDCVVIDGGITTVSGKYNFEFDIQ